LGARKSQIVKLKLKIVVNTCSIAQGMGVRKGSNNLSDLRGHLGSLASVPFDRGHIRCPISLPLSISCTVTEILSVICQQLPRTTTHHDQSPYQIRNI